MIRIIHKACDGMTSVHIYTDDPGEVIDMLGMLDQLSAINEGWA